MCIKTSIFSRKKPEWAVDWTWPARDCCFCAVCRSCPRLHYLSQTVPRHSLLSAMFCSSVDSSRCARNRTCSCSSATGELPEICTLKTMLIFEKMWLKWKLEFFEISRPEMLMVQNFTTRLVMHSKNSTRTPNENIHPWFSLKKSLFCRWRLECMFCFFSIRKIKPNKK